MHSSRRRCAARLDSGDGRFLSGWAAVNSKSVNLLPHDPSWAMEFLNESNAVARALGGSIQAIHHIGSTAIPGIHAKPVIDMLGVAPDLPHLDAFSPSLEHLGYEVLGEFGIPGRRYFRKNNARGIRTHHLHIYQDGSPQIARHLAFRDYLAANPSDASDYQALKLSLAADFANDSRRYTRGKERLISEIDIRAEAWKSQRSD